MKLSPSCNGIKAEISGLPDLSRRELLERWGKLYGNAPPKGISRALMIRAVAYGVQAKRHGGLKPAVARRLQRVTDRSSPDKKTAVVPAPNLRSGTRLVREWNGSTHVVDVVDGGFIWNGERHRSLSAIARAITGAHWSGPRFFAVSDGPS